MRRRKGFRRTEFAKHRARKPAGASPKERDRDAGAAVLADPVAKEIYDYLRTRGEAASLNDILEDCSFTRGEGREVKRRISALLDAGLLAKVRRAHFRIKEDAPLVMATMSVHPKGFAFATPLSPIPDLPASQDIFVSPRDLGTARHGDQVLLRIMARRRGRLEARVARIVTRRRQSVAGLYVAGRSEGLVLPDQENYPFSILVRKEHSLGARNGQAVLVEILESGEEARKNPPGRIVKILGDPEDLRVQADMVVHKFDLPHVWSDEALGEAEALSGEVASGAGREDLRPIPHVTIDGETARDFDDAVALEELPKGYRLYVSIADVSHYVRPGSTLDKEAFQRGTSVYFPNRVIPMLPERLSNNLCSLVPNEDRYAFSAILDFDAKGKVTARKFTKSVIRSRYRLTYTKVRSVLDEGAILDGDEGAAVTGMLRRMGILAAILENRRRDRGSIGFEIPEPWVELSEEEKIIAIRRSSRNRAHKLIEEFMLAANEAVAEEYARKGRDGGALFLYRIHETPDPVKVMEFKEFAQSMGLKLPKSGATPAWFGKVLGLVASTPREYIISNIMLRVMKQACYAPENAGHFGLAAKYYTHFTSPIRRYPDLMVHRALEDLVAGKEGQRKKGGMGPEETGIFLSKRERTAVDAERDMAERIQTRFMADKIGEEYDGIISGVTSFGLFVELLDSFVSGGISINDLTDDYYRVDEKAHRLVGTRKNHVYQIGDLVRVRVANVDLRRRRINFLLLSSDAAETE